MLAGKTQYRVNTKIKITFIEDDESKKLEGRTGRLTHPFPSLMWPMLEKRYIAGVWLDDLVEKRVDREICNLLIGDRFEVIEDKN